MTLAGERIQALFSELTLEDQTTVPRFENIWQKAELSASQPTRRSIRSLGVSAVVVVIAGLSAIFGPTSQESLSIPSVITAQIIESIATDRHEVGTTRGSRWVRSKISRRTNRNSARRKEGLNKEALMMRNVAMIFSWRSPTETLLESPGSAVLKSVPKLNESAKELESFLPNNE